MSGSPATAGSLARQHSVERFFQFSLLGLLTSGYLAVVGSGYLDLPTAALTAGALVFRGLLVAGLVKFPLTERWTAAITIAYIGFYPLDYLFFSKEFLHATVHLVFFLAIVKILTAASNRDYFYVLVIAFLELLAASVLSSRLNYFVFLALFLLFSVATLASWEIRRSVETPRARVQSGSRAFHFRLAGLAFFVSLGILIMTAGLFFLLPRTARAAFQHLVPDRFHLPVFSNQVTLGQIGEIKRQGRVLMHARIYSAEGPMHLKWRGMALGEFDGRKWFNSSNKGQPLRVENRLLRLADDDQRRRKGRRLNYEVHLKAFVSDALFIAGLPEFIQIDAPLVIRTASDSYRLGYRMLEGLRYGVYSFADETGADPHPVEPLPADTRATYLSLPSVDPRIPRLTRELTSRYASAEAQARAIENYLRTRFGYTIELPADEIHDPLGNFLFERRKGHCEYFASAMAVMLRTIGIPSRVATGFQSGVYNPVSGWHVIRASDAHSWVEAWFPDRGWVTFDPTPPDPSLAGETLWSRLTLYLDAADTFWQEWVLDYDLERQLTLAARMEQSRRSFSSNWYIRAGIAVTQWRHDAWIWLKRYGLTIVAGGLLMAAGIFAGLKLRDWYSGRRRILRVQRGLVEATDATVLYRRALRLLKRRGFEKAPWQTPNEFVRDLPASETATLFEELTASYNALRFGGKTGTAPRIMSLLERMERAKP